MKKLISIEARQRQHCNNYGVGFNIIVIDILSIKMPFKF